MEQGYNPGIYAVEGFCSDACFYNFWNKVQEYPTDEVGTDIADFGGKIIWLWNQAILYAANKTNPSVAKDLVPKVNNAIHIHSQQWPALPWWDSEKKSLWTYKNFHDKAKATLAQNLERCGRVQDAAKVFEELRMYDKARELRERDRHIIAKKTDVSVNLNALLQQVKDGGIVAIFRCPHCGGNSR